MSISLIKSLVLDNKPIPTDLKYEAAEIQKQLDWDDEAIEDDEYKWAGVEDPKIVVTTSHDPSSRLKQFAKVRSCASLALTVICFR